MQPIAIAKDTVVTLHYQLTLDDGSIADSSFGREPLTYLHGHGNLVPGLERQLLGRKPTDRLEAVVPAKEAYGEYDPEGDQRVPRSAFPPKEKLAPGMPIHGEDEHGNRVALFIKQIDGDEVVITSNHPLAGQRLNFKIEIVTVRKATHEEISHGHVHGPGGHHH